MARLMQTGSLVETVADFSESRRVWGLPYPNKGKILTVSNIEKHPNVQLQRKGIVLLHFIEIPFLPGICDKTVHGDENFKEVLPASEMGFMEELFSEKEDEVPILVEV